MCLLIIDRKPRILTQSLQMRKNLIRLLRNQSTSGNIHDLAKLPLLVKTKVEIGIYRIFFHPLSKQLFFWGSAFFRLFERLLKLLVNPKAKLNFISIAFLQRRSHNRQKSDFLLLSQLSECIFHDFRFEIELGFIVHYLPFTSSTADLIGLKLGIMYLHKRREKMLTNRLSRKEFRILFSNL